MGLFRDDDWPEAREQYDVDVCDVCGNYGANDYLVGQGSGTRLVQRCIEHEPQGGMLR